MKTHTVDLEELRISIDILESRLNILDSITKLSYNLKQSKLHNISNFEKILYTPSLYIGIKKKLINHISSKFTAIMS